jgi:Putative threonine/serine exporter
MKAINTISEAPPAPTWLFTLAAAAGAAALAVIFGVEHLSAAALVFLSAAAGAILRRSVAPYSANVFLQPFGAGLLAWTLPTAFLSGAGAAAGIAAVNSIGNLGGYFGPKIFGQLRDWTGTDFADLNARRRPRRRSRLPACYVDRRALCLVDLDTISVPGLGKAFA